MKIKSGVILVGLLFVSLQPIIAEGNSLILPKVVEAGSAFSIQNTVSGKSVLYIVGPGQAIRRDVQQNQTTFFPAGSLYDAGHYLAVLVGDTFTETGSFDVVPATRPASLSFIAKPSRLPVGLSNGISGAVYVFDAYSNLITTPETVTFKLSDSANTIQQRTMDTKNGAASAELNSTDKEGIDKFEATVDGVSYTRVIEQVPGDPCSLKMSAKPSGQKLLLETDTVRDCNGNAVPDGTIVTFTESYDGRLSTIDMPLKRGIAQVEMVAHPGARFSVASGIVLGNEIFWK